jgi:hypothetical protein
MTPCPLPTKLRSQLMKSHLEHGSHLDQDGPQPPRVAPSKTPVVWPFLLLGASVPLGLMGIGLLIRYGWALHTAH